MYNKKPTISDKILVYISRKTCANLEDIASAVGIKEDTAKVYLSRLAETGLIRRHWQKIPGSKKKFRVYCINTTVLKELNA